MKNLIGHGVNYERIYGGESRRATLNPDPFGNPKREIRNKSKTQIQSARSIVQRAKQKTFLLRTDYFLW
jgi:hypothetical protein